MNRLMFPSKSAFHNCYHQNISTFTVKLRSVELSLHCKSPVTLKLITTGYITLKMPCKIVLGKMVWYIFEAIW